jgi:hypothetical protein
MILNSPSNFDIIGMPKLMIALSNKQIHPSDMDMNIWETGPDWLLPL